MIDRVLRQVGLRRRTSIVPQIVLTPGFGIAVALLTLAGVVVFVAATGSRSGDELDDQGEPSPVRMSAD